MEEKIVEIPLEQLHDSPFNPRKVFVEAELEEMAQTMRPPGRVQQPIVVRPFNGGDPDVGLQRWEVVFGHRRVRAARLADLETIPAIVRDLADEDVEVAQIVENLQRAGVSPIEEADALRALQMKHGAKIEDLMARSGKSRSYVYNRLRLATAHGELRQAVSQGLIEPEIAVEVTRRPVAMQPAAMRDVRHMSYRQAKDHLERNWQFNLKRAPFDVLSLKLVPEAGACDACTKRSDVEPVLLDDYGADVCLDGSCYGRKAEAARKAAELKKRQEEAAARARPKVGERWRVRANVKGRGKTAGREGSVDEVRGDSVTLRWGPKSHEIGVYKLAEVEFVSGAPSVQQAQGITPQMAWPFPKFPNGQPSPSTDDAHEEVDDEDDDEPPLTPEQEAVIDRLSWKRICVAAMRNLLARPRTTDELRMLLERELELGDSDFGDVAEMAMGWDIPLDAGSEPRLEKLKSMTADELGGLIVVNALQRGPMLRGGLGTAGLAAARTEWAKKFGVDDLLNPDVQAPAQPAPPPSTAAQAQGKAAGKATKKKAAPAAKKAKATKTKRLGPPYHPTHGPRPPGEEQKDDDTGDAGVERDTKTADMFAGSAA